MRTRWIGLAERGAFIGTQLKPLADRWALEDAVMRVRRSWTQIQPNDGLSGAQFDRVPIFVYNDLHRSLDFWYEAALEVNGTNGIRLLTMTPDVSPEDVVAALVNLGRTP
jgi:hypothetical protein